MSFTQILPTDKYGAVYYGPKTMREAERQIDDDGAPAQEVADSLRSAGYTGLADRIQKRYCRSYDIVMGK